MLKKLVYAPLALVCAVLLFSCEFRSDEVDYNRAKYVAANDFKIVF